jgi:hypothetical protein
MRRDLPRFSFSSGLAGILAALTLLGGCLASERPADGPPPDRAAMAAAWADWRAERDSLFASDASPLLPAARATFRALPYFAYDSLLAVAAALVPALRPDTALFPTTTGELRPMTVAGQLVFRAGGTERRLVAYQPVEPGAPGGPGVRLFVPFRDGTSGRETYGGGRYLDLDVSPSGRYALDFNRAYHPYCVYAPDFSCPLPPPENTLSLEVRAGERLGADEAR